MELAWIWIGGVIVALSPLVASYWIRRRMRQAKVRATLAQMRHTAGLFIARLDRLELRIHGLQIEAWVEDLETALDVTVWVTGEPPAPEPEEIE